MNIEELRSFCCSLPAVTEDVKWGNNLVFSVGDKMFCLADLDPPLQIALKVPEPEFIELTETADIIQAPYFARAKWIKILNEDRFNRMEWEHYIRQSYELVKLNLSRKMRENIG